MIQTIREWFAERKARLAIASDPFLSVLSQHIKGLFNDPSYAENNVFVNNLQNHLSAETRTIISEQVTEFALTIANSKDRILACREMAIIAMKNFAPIYVVMSEPPSNDTRHPCLKGLFDVKEVVIQDERASGGMFYDIYRKAGSIEDAIAQLNSLAYRGQFDLDLTNFARIQLGDVEKEGKDWFRTYFHSLAAYTENTIREQVELPVRCDAFRLLLEHVSIEDNLRKGYKNPLDDVRYAHGS